ncbi:hypothetical protein TeGR_g13668, partial [Tetraparma gracilis]
AFGNDRGSKVAPPLPPDEARVLLDDFLLLLPKLFDLFDRSVEVDDAILKGLAEYFETSTTATSKEENELIDEVVGYEEQDWERIRGTVLEPVEYFQVLAKPTSMFGKNTSKSSVGADSDESVEGAWGKATVNIDISADRCLAFFWHHMSSESNAKFEKNNGRLLRMQVDVPDSHTTFTVTSAKSPFPGVDNRVYASKWSWRREENGAFVAGFTFKGSNEYVERAIKEDARARGCTQGTLQGFYRFTPLAANVCHATLVFQVTVGGSVPVRAMNYGVRNALGNVEDLRDKYERNGKAVDAELRGAFPPLPLLQQLDDEQARIAKSGLGLETGSAAVEWTKLASTSPFVELAMQHTKPVGREASIALGMAKATLDCSATEALVYQFAAFGREKMRISREEGNRARVIFKEHTKHDIEWALVVKFPFPLTNREFLHRCLCFEDMTGDLIFVFEALPDSTKVDYGANLKVVRAKSTGVLRFKPTNDDAQCEVTLVQHLDAAGFVPKRVVVAMIPQALSGVGEMRELFQRDDNIDGAKRSELAGIINDRPQVYTDDELDILDFMTDTLGMLKEEKFEKLESPDHFVHMSSVFKEESSSGILRATTTVDAPIAEVAAWEMAKMSRENLKVHVQDGGLDRDIVKINDHQNIYHVVYDFSIPTFLPRQWVNKLIWKWAADKKELTVVGDDVVYDGFPEREEYLRASSTVVVKYKQEAKVGEIPQTKVTYTQQVDLGGRIPKWVQNRQGVGQLMYLSTMRKRFDQSPAIETVSNLRLVTMIQNHDEPYTEKEEAILRDGASRLSKFDTTAKSRELKMLSRTTKAKLAYEAKDNYAYGWASTTVRASPEQVLAHLWDIRKRSGVAKDDIEKVIDEAPNKHDMVFYIRKKAPRKPISDREFFSRAVWKKLSRNSGFVLVTVPESGRPALRGVVRGKYPSTMKITRTERNAAKIEYVIHPDAGGRIPLWVMLRNMNNSLATVTRVKEHFLSRRGLGGWDEEDGEAVGEVLVTKTDAEKHHESGETRAEARVGAMMEAHKGLKELGQKHEWIEVLLKKVVANKLRPAGDSKVKLYVWFRPMMDTIAQRLLESVGWGLKMRLYTGAGLSTMDLISDVFMIYTYATTGYQGTALSLAVMVGLCVGVQLITTFLQTRNAPRVVMIKEMLSVLSGVASGIHAMRVANGADQSEHAAMHPEMELVFTRCTEMVFESVPGTVLQISTCLQSMKGDDGFSKVALGSIIVSALTTGFSAATISFDFDVNPKRRRDEPDFYGYIPDAASSRTLIFLCMIINCALLLLVRSVSMALLAMVGSKWVLAYLVSDMGLYFVYKILRRDLWHWVALEGAASVVESVLERFVVKVLVDFTGVVQFRGAGEMGASYFTFNMIMALAASFVATRVYYASLDEPEDAVMDESVAWTIVGGLSGLGVSFFACFLLLMKPAYRRTFFSTQTGYAWVQSYFVSGQTDEVKKRIFEHNKKQWGGIRDDVKAWTVENWERWEEETPAWFGDAWKAGVDDDMIPPESLRKLNGGGSARRRSSLGGVLGVSARVAPVGGGDLQ